MTPVSGEVQPVFIGAPPRKTTTEMDSGTFAKVLLNRCIVKRVTNRKNMLKRNHSRELHNRFC